MHEAAKAVPRFLAGMNSSLTPATLEAAIRQMTDYLLATADDLTYNKLSRNCRYIFSEITDNPGFRTERDRFRWLQRQLLVPRQLADLMPLVLSQYDNLYDINLFVHQATRRTTVIDIRFYPRSALVLSYRQTVASQPPMLHTKLVMPYWIDTKRQKFDINWKVYAPISGLKRWGLTQKWRLFTAITQRTVARTG